MDNKHTKPKVVILGGGFGGLSAAKRLSCKAVDVTLIDQRNHHLFQPLLYQVATAALTPQDVAWPVRAVFRGAKNVRVLMNSVQNVDTKKQRVHLQDGIEIPYDYLILATGAQKSYFGNDHWEQFAPALKTIGEATQIRAKILRAFELAEMEQDVEKRKELLTFVIVGGGPTGVELAGAISELAHHALAEDFRRIRSDSARIILVDGGDRVLKMFPPELSAKAQESLEKMGVEIILNVRVEDVTAEGVTYSGTFLPAKVILWGAGVQASPAAKWLDVEADRGGRIVVTDDFSVPNLPNVFAVGDTAAYTQKGAEMALPGVAPVAKQGGLFVAKLIEAKVANKRKLPTFNYKDYGNLATIGRKAAVVDFGWLKMSGFFAWVLWSLAHVYFLIGYRRRMVVAMSWMWQYLTYRRGARLITGKE